MALVDKRRLPRPDMVLGPLAFGERIEKSPEERRAAIAAREREKARQEAEAKAQAVREAKAERERQDQLVLANGTMQEKQHLLATRRCEREHKKPILSWTPITPDVVMSNHNKVDKGMIYGINFPWDQETLTNMGPSWLTKAMQTAGTLSSTNRVTSLKVRQSLDAGNNAAKFLIDVSYAQADPVLHTKLFVKAPYPMTKETQSDRISSSVLKQPMDFFEIQTYRLLESNFPVQIPKYYFGDISTKTSNFILVLEQLPYAELDGRKEQLQPGEIEGPYDKARDHLLRSDPTEYYMLLVKKAALIAGAHKSGKMGPPEVLDTSVLRMDLAKGPPPDDAATVDKVLDVGVKFFSETAKALYPSYVTDQAFQAKFLSTMKKFNKYQQKIEVWKNTADPNLVALGHQNLNIDNAYFWRTSDGELDCGLLDWGGFGVSSLGHKIWWTFNTAEFDCFRDNLPEVIDLFASVYEANGGGPVDKAMFRKHLLLTSLGNMMFMIKAVPNCFKMVPLKEWAEITSRDDPRIAKNTHGKSTLRTTVHVLNNTLRALQEIDTDKVLDQCIAEQGW